MVHVLTSRDSLTSLSLEKNDINVLAGPSDEDMKTWHSPPPSHLLPPNTTILDVSSPKGLTNAMSSWLSGVYLAALLGWGILLPTVHSSEWGENNDVWGQYSNYHEVDFQEIFDQKFFITSIETRFGVPVLAGRPASYLDASNGCQDNRCRGSFDDLVHHFGKIKGNYVVKGPNIASGIIDSKAHLKGVRDVASYLRLSAVNFETAQAAVNAMKLNGTIIFLHFRYEPDAMKIGYAGSPETFLDDVLLSLNRIVAVEDLRAVIYFASGLNMSTILSMPPVEKFLNRFSHATAVNRESLGIPKYTFMARNAAVDGEIGVQSDLFFGTVQTSFTAFVMLGRRTRGKDPGTSYAFGVREHDDKCSGIMQHHGDWQMELSIPYNDCLHPDPCEMCSKWASLSNWMISESCATQGTDSQDMKFCSGMMGKYMDCR